jgi:hypothetical protein
MLVKGFSLDSIGEIAYCPFVTINNKDRSFKMRDIQFKFSSNLAAKLGVIPAVLYDFFLSFARFMTENDAQEHDLIEQSAFRFDGLIYRSISVENIQKEMPFLTIHQIRNGLAKLEKSGAIIALKTGKMSYKNSEDGFMSRYDATKAYAIA